MLENSKEIAALQMRRYESYKLAEELRRSSDDLTRMARTYTVTGDKRFLDYFHKIVGIRDGQEARPQNYDHIFWDFVTNTHKYPETPGRKVSIITLFQELHIQEKELALLHQAKQSSDDLIHMERRAFNAMEGRFLNNRGEYIKTGQPDPKLAREIVHSPAYHEAKAKIMKDINEFFLWLENRTSKEVRSIEDFQNHLLLLAILLSFTLILLSIVSFKLFRDIISKPLSNIQSYIEQVELGQYKLNTGSNHNDEIGKLAKAFVKMAQKISLQIKTLDHTSRTDALTNINNRIALDEALIKEKYKFDRYSTECSILMVDLDHFKKVNDKYGHLAGDEVLKHFSKLLKEHVRESDIAGRWGGEEFLIICPNTNITDCRRLGELIRKRITEYDFPKIGRLNASFGAGTFEKSVTIEKVINMADTALYKAKARGRNRVC